VTGPSIADLVKKKDAALDTKTRADLTAALGAARAIPAPFDSAIVGADDSDGRKKLKAAIDAWAVVTADIEAVATTLGVTINLAAE
jgi:putative iron-regulated protein